MHNEPFAFRSLDLVLNDLSRGVPLRRARHAIHVENLRAARSRALKANSARFLGGAFVRSELRNFPETVDISSTAATNAASFAFDGLLKPLTFRTNCNAAARISSSVTGGAKLKRILIFLHIDIASMCQCLTEQFKRRRDDGFEGAPAPPRRLD